MRSTWKTLAAAVATALVAPQFANADDVEERLQQMQERMDQLEDQLAATNDQLEASTTRVEEQERVIERAGLDDRSAASSLSRFLEMTEISGFIAASWNYNFNNPDASALGMQAPEGIASPAGTVNGWNSGALGLTAPLHSNPNTFQVDQLWFSLKKPVSGAPNTILAPSSPKPRKRVTSRENQSSASRPGSHLRITRASASCIASPPTTTRRFTRRRSLERTQASAQKNASPRRARRRAAVDQPPA